MKHMDRLAAAPTQSFSRALSSCAGPNHGDESQAGILCSGSLGDISKRHWQVPDLASDSAGQRSTEVMRCASTVSAQLLRLRGGGEGGREGKQGGASNPVVQIPSIKKSMTVSNNHPLALTISSTLIHFFFLSLMRLFMHSIFSPRDNREASKYWVCSVRLPTYSWHFSPSWYHFASEDWTVRIPSREVTKASNRAQCWHLLLSGRFVVIVCLIISVKV